MIAIVFQLFREIKELLALWIDMKLAIHNPALAGAVLNRVPDVAVAGNDAVPFGFQLRGCFEELIPARTHFTFDLSRIIRPEYFLGN
ncbi:hypothetical protein D3C87_1818750 [compost metagenome]